MLLRRPCAHVGNAAIVLHIAFQGLRWLFYSVSVMADWLYIHTKPNVDALGAKSVEQETRLAPNGLSYLRSKLSAQISFPPNQERSPNTF
jgi:hypothetical protein